ncbi:hypothetical protein MCOR03_002703 [Pyricularia oryzae]|nr:hypothetical protein MCOR03_002703 [Pyricularia oryzae]
MKVTSALLTALAVATVNACGVPPTSLPRTAARTIFRRADAKMYTLETAPGVTIEVTEEEKLAMMDNRVHFFDITEWKEAPNAMAEDLQKRIAAVPYPKTLTQKCNATKLIGKLDKERIQATVERYSSFFNRYYMSETGRQSVEWLHDQIKAVLDAADIPGANIRLVRHNAWVQPSIVVTLPGREARTVVVGGHADSIVSGDRNGRQPGADDDASASATIFEAMRVFLMDPRVKAGQLLNTMEFHWYAAEEAGLLGSQDIFNTYRQFNRNIVAMLQQDMTGYIGRDGRERFGLITDFTDPDLVNFMKLVIDSYTDIPYEESLCGYACSDHGSATRAGYPSTFVFETPFGNHNPYIHTINDTTDKLSYDHMIQHGKLITGYLSELAWWPFV